MGIKIPGQWNYKYCVAVINNSLLEVFLSSKLTQKKEVSWLLVLDNQWQPLTPLLVTLTLDTPEGDHGNVLDADQDNGGVPGQCGAGPDSPHTLAAGVKTREGGPRTNVSLANDSHVCQPLTKSIHHHTTRMSTKRLVSDYYHVKMNETWRSLIRYSDVLQFSDFLQNFRMFYSRDKIIL